jgi:hypothetical protein
VQLANSNNPLKFGPTGIAPPSASGYPQVIAKAAVECTCRALIAILPPELLRLRFQFSAPRTHTSRSRGSGFSRAG